MVKYYIKAAIKVANAISQLAIMLVVSIIAILLCHYCGVLWMALYIGAVFCGYATHVIATRMYEEHRNEVANEMQRNWREFDSFFSYAPNVKYAIEPYQNLMKAMENYATEFGKDKDYQYYETRVKYCIASRSLEWKNAMEESNG